MEGQNSPFFRIWKFWNWSGTNQILEEMLKYIGIMETVITVHQTIHVYKTSTVMKKFFKPLLEVQYTGTLFWWVLILSIIYWKKEEYPYIQICSSWSIEKPMKHRHWQNFIPNYAIESGTNFVGIKMEMIIFTIFFDGEVVNCKLLRWEICLSENVSDG